MAKGWVEIYGAYIDTDSRKGTWWISPDEIQKLSPEQKQKLLTFFQELAVRLNSQGIVAEAMDRDAMETFYRKKWFGAYLLTHDHPLQRDIIPRIANELLAEKQEKMAVYHRWERSKKRHTVCLSNKNKQDYLEDLLTHFTIGYEGKSVAGIEPEDALLAQLVESSIKRPKNVMEILKGYTVEYADPAEKHYRGSNATVALLNAIIQQERGFERLSG